MLLAHGADPNAPVESSGTPMSQAAQDPELTELLRRHGGRQTDVRSRSRRDGSCTRDGSRKPSGCSAPILSGSTTMRPAGGTASSPGRRATDATTSSRCCCDSARACRRSRNGRPTTTSSTKRRRRSCSSTGMDPNHMNWHRFTLLHHMAAEGELGKARLLLDHGADIDAIDEEYRSTPLGVAARRGQAAAVSAAARARRRSGRGRRAVGDAPRVGGEEGATDASRRCC